MSDLPPKRPHGPEPGPEPTIPEPDWKRWTRIGSAGWDEATHLTLGWDPDSLSLIEKARCNHPKFDQAFNQRAEVLIEWLRNTHPEAPSGSIPDKRRFRIPLPELARICLIHRWALPAELDALAEPTSATDSPSEEQVQVPASRSARWPWGEYSTPALEAFARIAARHIVNGQVSTQAKVVQSDLENEGIKARTAGVIAQLLTWDSQVNQDVAAHRSNKKK